MIQEADRLFRRYMNCLGWLGDPGLVELVRTHVVKVPVENVSALLGRGGAKGLTDVERFIEGIERYDLGGDAFTNNGYFAELLRYLDYDVELLGADVDGEPLQHAVCQVLHEDRPHLVDLGLGAPFYEPLPLDRLPLRIESGYHVYVLDRHRDAGCFEMTTLRRGARHTSYVVRPEPRKLADFGAVIRGQLAAGSPALAHLRITRIFPSHVAAIDDRTVSITRHNETESREVSDPDALVDAVVTDLQLPRAPIHDALAALDKRGVKLFG